MDQEELIELTKKLRVVVSFLTIWIAILTVYVIVH